MKKQFILLPIIILSSCSGITPPKEEVISLYSETSRLYLDSFKDEDSCSLKTYRHKHFGEIPYVELGEYFDTFEKTEIKDKKECLIKDEKFYVTSSSNGVVSFDASNDIVVTSSDIAYFFKNSRRINNNIPHDIFTSSDGYEKFVKGSGNTSYKVSPQERTYDLKKYNFDIVYEKGKYYAPFSVLTYLFYGYLNSSFIYNGKHFFDVDSIYGSKPNVQYCYSSNGDFLLDRSGGKLGASLYKKSNQLQENEAYRFVNVIEQSGQTTVVSCLKGGKGTIKSYDSEGKYIDDGTYIKLNYSVNEDKSEITIDYFTTLDEEDMEPISDIVSMRINLDETLFRKQTRSKSVADFTYQELRFAMYELYGKTTNTSVKDFDNFIKDKEYKNDLLSLDISKYDDAMSKFLLLDIDDVHTSIEYTSIYGEPTFANSNHYTSTYQGERGNKVFRASNGSNNARKEAGIGALDIVNNTAFVAFSKFEFTDQIKGFDEYKNTNPEQYALNNSMEFFASAFNRIKENNNIKNVVIDLSGNTGGRTASLSYLLAYLTKEPTILSNLELDRSVIEFKYQVDLNQDGLFGTDSDSFENKYSFYVLTSGGTFSCGTVFTGACKNYGLAKIIGEKSGGGSCVVSMLCNSSGYLYHSSSEFVNMLKDGNGYKDSDAGVDVDIPLESSKFFDHTYIDSLISEK